jgi:hypothetical protein
MTSRTLAISGLILAALLAISIFIFWFFSNPADLTRQQATAALVTFAAQALALAAVTGFASMATLEMAKRLFHLRGWFFMRGIGEDIKFALIQAGWRRRYEPENIPAEAREPSILTAPAVQRFDIPLEQLIAQISHLADRELSAFDSDRPGPLRSPALNGLLGPVAAPPWWDESAGSVHPAEREDWAGEYLVSMRADTEAALDNLQVRLGAAWRARLRLASCGLAALFAAGALIYVPVPPGTKTAALVTSFVLGGFLAGFFRDVAALVERFRR